MKKKFWIIGGVLAAVALLLVFVVRPLVFGKKPETIKIEQGLVSEVLVLSGEVKAEKDASLKFSTAGKIAWVGASEGEMVKKGQALAKLDTTNLNSALQKARSDLRAAEAAVAKVHDDVKNHSTDETYAQKDTRTASEVAKDKAYEAVIQAEDNLRNATLYAPFAGTITYVNNVYPGVNVSVTDVITEVIDLNTIYFDVAADQNEIVDLKQSMKVKVLLDSFAEQELNGEIVYLGASPKEGEAGAVYEVKVKINDLPSGLNLRIGMTGDAKFVISEKDNVLYAPPKFVKTDTKGKYVSKGSQNNKVYIEVGIDGEDRIEIIGDIKPGDVLYD